jgi:hypothetical protein
LAGLYTFGSQIKAAKTASTTCSFRAPTQGTSTLQFASFKLSSTTSNALVVEIGRGTLDATTTLLGTTYNVAANAMATIVASTSPAAGDAIVFAPGQFLNIKVGGAAAGGIGGTCDAEFQLN